MSGGEGGVRGCLGRLFWKNKYSQNAWVKVSIKSFWIFIGNCPPLCESSHNRLLHGPPRLFPLVPAYTFTLSPLFSSTARYKTYLISPHFFLTPSAFLSLSPPPSPHPSPLSLCQLLYLLAVNTKCEIGSKMEAFMHTADKKVGETLFLNAL